MNKLFSIRLRFPNRTTSGFNETFCNQFFITPPKWGAGGTNTKNGGKGKGWRIEVR